MTIEAKVIEDSFAPNGVRLTTMQLKYPRFIHAEFMTHRVMSRNASSSRAIPVKKLIAEVRENPAMPSYWGANQAGMQAKRELIGKARGDAEMLWRAASKQAAAVAESFAVLGLHKQITNRILEPFLHISVIVTSTEWDNFFALRTHRDAQPEMQELALAMQAAMRTSVPVLREGHQANPEFWHLPYIRAEERRSHAPKVLARVSAARCARVSYLTHDGFVPDFEADIKLYNRLVGSAPIHASPVEHQAFPSFNSKSWCKNFRGWVQFRELVEHETIMHDLEDPLGR